MLFDMLECSTILKKYNLNIVYNGPLWADGVEGLADSLKKKMLLDELPMSVSQTIFSVFVEQMNNMLMYSAETDTSTKGEGSPSVGLPQGAFVMGTKEDCYFLQSGNMMHAKNIEPIKEQIEYLNTLDKKELRKYYKEMMKKENENPESKGAGLGLIEIARRSTSGIIYSFTPIDDDKSYFTMYIEIEYS